MLGQHPERGPLNHTHLHQQALDSILLAQGRQLLEVSSS